MLSYTKRIALLAAMLTFCLLSLFILQTSAASQPVQKSGDAAKSQKREKDEENERRVRMKDLPAAVRKTVREQSVGARVRGLSQEMEQGQTFYEVELRVGGHTKDVLMDASGSVVEIEEQVETDSLPPAVKDAIAQSAVKGELTSVESITKGGAIVAYEAHVRQAGKWLEIKVRPDGQLIPKDEP